jgi:hypothetical protein
LRTLQNFLFQESVVTFLYRAPGQDVHGFANQLGHFRFHAHMIYQTLVGIVSKSNQQIDITIRSEISAQHGAKERQLGDLPLPAELF